MMKVQPAVEHLAPILENAWHRTTQFFTATTIETRTMWFTFVGLLAAIVTLIIAVWALVISNRNLNVAFRTLDYMHLHDAETDTRNGWIEIHEAMVNLRAQREFVLGQKGAMGSYGSGAPNAFEERKREYDLATAQLRGQLDRLNDDSLLTDVAAFLDKNNAMEQWQTEQYEKTFDEFAHKVALKSRPK